MATERHPVTGVLLNAISIERKSLDFDEAITVWLMRLNKTKFQTIAQRLGTNTARVGEVLRCEVHPRAREAAWRILRQI